jgi:glutamate formiminotransferase/formiminotetrahydrofolate cyclodeaminase
MELGKAGATVIGARNFLIAFNVYLATEDVEIARQVAKAIRHSSGGLRYVKALGLLVDGRAQVSMNLTNYKKTPIARVVETIRREAERYGVGIHHSELVGLIPQEALADAAVWYTQLDQFEADQVLESRLYAASAGDPARDFPSFLDEVAAPTATPGGGSAAAYTSAIGAGLVAMVAGLTLSKKKYADVEAEMQAIRVRAEKLREELTHGVEDDAAAFEAVMGAFRLPKGTKKEEKARAASIQRATLNAAHVPLHVAEQSFEVMELALRCAEKGNSNAISDAAAAVTLARAGLMSAGYNVRINVASLSDPASGEKYLAEMSDLEVRAASIEQEIRRVLQERGGLSL